MPKVEHVLTLALDVSNTLSNVSFRRGGGSDGGGSNELIEKWHEA